MKGYVLTDRDIRILVGAAGNAVCEDHDFSEEQEKMIMGMSGICLEQIHFQKMSSK